MENINSKWVPEVRHHCPDTPIVLVGTKKDLRDDPEFIKILEEKDQKPITQKDGEAMKQTVGAADFGECSARTQDGLRDIFNKCIAVVLEPPQEEKKTGKTKSSGGKCMVL